MLLGDGGGQGVSVDGWQRSGSWRPLFGEEGEGDGVARGDRRSGLKKGLKTLAGKGDFIERGVDLVDDDDDRGWRRRRRWVERSARLCW